MDLIFPLISGIEIQNITEILGSKESSVIWDPSEDSIEGIRQGETRCEEALQGTTGQDPCLERASEAPIGWEQHLSPTRKRTLNCTLQIAYHLFKLKLENMITKAPDMGNLSPQGPL